MRIAYGIDFANASLEAFLARFILCPEAGPDTVIYCPPGYLYCEACGSPVGEHWTLAERLANGKTQRRASP